MVPHFILEHEWRSLLSLLLISASKESSMAPIVENSNSVTLTPPSPMLPNSPCQFHSGVMRFCSLIALSLKGWHCSCSYCQRLWRFLSTHRMALSAFLTCQSPELTESSMTLPWGSHHFSSICSRGSVGNAFRSRCDLLLQKDEPHIIQDKEAFVKILPSLHGFDDN